MRVSPGTAESPQRAMKVSAQKVTRRPQTAKSPCKNSHKKSHLPQTFPFNCSIINPNTPVRQRREDHDAGPKPGPQGFPGGEVAAVLRGHGPAGGGGGGRLPPGHRLGGGAAGRAPLDLVFSPPGRYRYCAAVPPERDGEGPGHQSGAHRGAGGRAHASAHRPTDLCGHHPHPPGGGLRRAGGGGPPAGGLRWGAPWGPGWAGWCIWTPRTGG